MATKSITTRRKRLRAELCRREDELRNLDTRTPEEQQELARLHERMAKLMARDGAEIFRDLLAAGVRQ